MTTTRPFRSWPDYISALFVFVGTTALLVAHAEVFNDHDVWLLITGIVGLVLGLILRERRTPEPWQPVTAPKAMRWLWLVVLLASLIMLPRIDWRGPWLVVMFLIAVITATLTSVVSMHHQIARQRQEQREINTAAGNIPHDTGSSKNVP